VRRQRAAARSVLLPAAINRSQPTSFRHAENESRIARALYEIHQTELSGTSAQRPLVPSARAFQMGQTTEIKEKFSRVDA